jgi:hypothetical protein
MHLSSRQEQDRTYNYDKCKSHTKERKRYKSSPISETTSGARAMLNSTLTLDSGIYRSLKSVHWPKWVPRRTSGELVGLPCGRGAWSSMQPPFPTQNIPSCCHFVRHSWDFCSVILLQWTHPFYYSAQSFYDFVKHSQDFRSVNLQQWIQTFF